MCTENNVTDPFALLLSLDRKFVNTSHNNIECFNAQYDILYLGNKFTIDYYRDIVSREMYSRCLVIVLDVQCSVVFISLRSYLTENTARTSYEDYSWREVVCVRSLHAKCHFYDCDQNRDVSTNFREKISDTRYNGNPSRRNLPSTRGSVA
jgi:hypothetical protein